MFAVRSTVFPITSVFWWWFTTCTPSGLSSSILAPSHSRVIIAFLELLFSRWGLPETSTTDNCPKLVAAEFRVYLPHRGIHHARTAYYHPQANGGVEHFHQSPKNSLRAHMAQGCSFLHYRATQHAITDISPSFLVGWGMNMPLDRLRPPGPLGFSPTVRATVVS